MAARGSFFSNLVATVKSAAIEAVEETKKGVAMMRDFPSSVPCAACKKNVPLPPTYWDWTCDSCQSHLTSAVPMCCGVKRPTFGKTYTYACPVCAAVLSVPTSNATQMATKGWNETCTFVKNAPSKAREAYEHAKALPVQFNCKNCNVLLDRPRDAWSCNVCRVDNDWSAPKCVAPACADKTKTRPPQRVMCGVCQKPTAVPTTNIANTFTYGKTQIMRNARKVQYTVGKKAYITCTSCSEHVAVPPERIVDAPEGGSAGAGAGGASAAARYSVDDDDAAAAISIDNIDINDNNGGVGGGGEGALVPGVAIPSGDATVGVDVIACTACGAHLEYTHRTVVTAQEVPLTDLSNGGEGGGGVGGGGGSLESPFGADGGGIQALQHATVSSPSNTTSSAVSTPSNTTAAAAAVSIWDATASSSVATAASVSSVATASSVTETSESQPSTTASSSLAEPLLDTADTHAI